MRKSGHEYHDALYILNFVQIALIVLQISGIALLPIASNEWFLTFPSYRFWLPTIIGLMVVALGIHAVPAGWTSGAVRDLYRIVLLLWLLALFVLWVWLWIEAFWYCQRNLSVHTVYYCYDPVQNQLATGYILFVIATLVQWPVFVIQFACYSLWNRRAPVTYKLVAE